jgi:hypothetical protein
MPQNLLKEKPIFCVEARDYNTSEMPWDSVLDNKNDRSGTGHLFFLVT